MGLASGKAKLKLIDIDSKEAREDSRSRHGPVFGEPSSARRAAFTEDHGDASTSEIGSILRDARERSGQTLRDASRNLLIRMEYLGAIEEGDFKALPGMTYAVGYVRTYAQYLGLDVERAIALFKAEASDLTGPRQLVFPSPAPEGKVPGGALMFVAAFLAILGYAGWFHITDSGRAVAGYSLEVPEVLQSWLDEPSTGASSDGFTTAAIAASPSPSSSGAPITEPAGDEARIAPTLVPLSETSVVAVAPTVTPEIMPEIAPEIMREATATSPQALASSNTEAATGATNETTRLETAAVETSAPAASDIAEAASTPLAATSDASSEKTPPVVVASLAGSGGGEFSGLSPDAGQVAAAPTVVPQPVAAPQPAPTPIIVAAAPVASQDVSIPEAPDMSRSEPSTTPPIAARKVADAKRARVVIKASAASWVQVRASDSSTIMTKVMRAGDVYEVPDRNGLRLFTGNAGALTILVDGKPIRGIGGSGEVARNIDLAPDTLEKQVN